jgi:hypothetical protein
MSFKIPDALQQVSAFRPIVAIERRRQAGFKIAKQIHRRQSARTKRHTVYPD